MLAFKLVSPVPLPLKLAALRLPVKVLLEAANVGTFVVSRFRVTLLPSATEPPPVRSVPAATVSDELASMVFVTPPVAMLSVPLLVMGPPVKPAPLPTLVTVPVPVPGKVCPEANVTCPLLAIDKPVSAGVLPPEPNSKFRLADGDDVLFPTGSACQRNSSFTAALVPLLYADAAASIVPDLYPWLEVAVPVGGSTAPAAVSAPLKLAPPPETDPVALTFPVTL